VIAWEESEKHRMLPIIDIGKKFGVKRALQAFHCLRVFSSKYR